MKVFVFNGSFRGSNSTGEKVAQSIHGELLKQYSKLEFIYRSGQNSNILICKGCGNCFYGKECSLQDDINIMKKEMENSDILILISPVFVHNVSSIMKIYLDRISSWTHQMRLAGKMGVIISVSDNNGNSFVNEYLKKIMNYLGVSVIQQLSITNESYNDEEIEKVAKTLVQNIKNTIDYTLIEIDKDQERIYENFKTLYEHKMLPGSDYTYFNKIDFFQEANYYEEFIKRSNLIGGLKNGK